MVDRKVKVTLSAVVSDFEKGMRAAAQAEKLGFSLDESSVSGSANAAAMGELAEKARAAAEAQFEQDLATMSADDAAKKWNDTLAAQRQAFIDSAIAAGYNADEVQALADRIFQMPPEKQIDMLVETAQAQSQIDKFVTLNNGKRVKVLVDVEGNQSFTVGGKTVSAEANGGFYSGGVEAFAGGGFEPGIYPYAQGGIHKFAEEYDEAYISLDPARKGRSEAVWVRTGQELGMFGQGQAAQTPAALPPINVVVQSKGGINLLDYVDVRVEQSNDALGSGLRGA